MEIETMSMIKSCVASRKGGVPLVELDDEYQDLVGESIPFKSLGFQSLGSFILSIPEIKVFRNQDGTMMLNLQDDKVAHITAMVNKQKAAPLKWRGKNSLKNIKRNAYGKRRKFQAHSNTLVGKENSNNGQNDIPKKKTNKHSPNKISNIRSERDVIMNAFPTRNGHSSYHDRFLYKKAVAYRDDIRLPLSSYSDEKNHRQATMIGDVLTVTVKTNNFRNYKNSDDICSANGVSENDSFHDDNLLANDKVNYDDDLKEFIEPTLFHHQMIGDDFFLHLAEKSLGAYTHRRSNLLCSSGLCISGQRIQECWQRVLNGQFLGDNVILLLGAVDILEGKDLSDLKSNMLGLLEALLLRVSSLVILTVPPLVNICHIQRKWLTLQSYNRWLQQLDKGKRCRVLDIWPLFRGGRVKMFDCYEYSPRKVVRSFASAVLWNEWGRKHVIEFLRRELFYQH